MANSVDPDQTAPLRFFRSGSALFAYVILWDILVFKILGHLSYYLKYLDRQALANNVDQNQNK